MDITIKYMLRPVAHCKEGCCNRSWGTTLNYPRVLEGGR